MDDKKKNTSVLTLHRYFIWANHMRSLFDRRLKETVQGNRLNDIRLFEYLSLWYSILYVVVEGWHKLRLSDTKIDKLIESPNVDLLRKYRNCVFHFQKDYYDKRMIKFIDAGHQIVKWVRELNDEFGRYFLCWINPEKYSKYVDKEI